MSNWSTPSRVIDTIRAGDQIAEVQGKNRARIMSAANCNPPLGREKAKKLGIKIDVNWGELLVLLTHGQGQLINAFLGSQYFFTVKVPDAPQEIQSELGAFITENINQPMQDSDEWFEVHNSRWSSVVTHGPGLMFWPKEDHWLPEFCALSDVRIPTDTVRSFKNLNWVARRVMYTPMELMDSVFNDKEPNHWDKQAIYKILKAYKNENFTDATNNYDWETSIEKMVELAKQDGGYWGGDAVPAIPLYHFYFKDTDTKWYQLVVPELGQVKSAKPEDSFLWESDVPVADSWREILHCQHGDLSVDAPFKFHTERGLGFILLEPTFYTNLTRCRMLQHVHDNLNIWFTSSDNAEKARVSIQEFGNNSVIKQGLKVVPQSERPQIQANLLEMAFGQLKQLTSEASASYTQQPDTGTQKEQTAFETRVKVEQVNALMASILTKCFKYEGYAHREICRRFCLKGSTDPDIMEFQDKWKKAGYPLDLMNVKYWRVEPVTPLGMGNPTIAQAEVQQLQQLSPKLNAQAQNEINHESVLVITKDWRKAQRWAPLKGPPTESDATREAAGMFSTIWMMTPGKFPLSQSNLIDQIKVLLVLYQDMVEKITKTKQMASDDDSNGFQSVSEYIGRAIAALAQDPQQKQVVKQFEDTKAQQDNLARALIQRGQQAKQKAQQQNGNGEAAKAALDLKLKGAEGVQRLKLKEQENAQTMRHREANFLQERRIKALETAVGLVHDHVKTKSDVANARLRSIPKDDE